MLWCRFTPSQFLCCPLSSGPPASAALSPSPPPPRAHSPRVGLGSCQGQLPLLVRPQGSQSLLIRALRGRAVASRCSADLPAGLGRHWSPAQHPLCSHTHLLGCPSLRCRTVTLCSPRPWTGSGWSQQTPEHVNQWIALKGPKGPLCDPVPVCPGLTTSLSVPGAQSWKLSQLQARRDLVRAGRCRPHHLSQLFRRRAPPADL